MKKVLLATFLLFFSSAAYAEGERILSFDSDITVHQDSTLTVRETIRAHSEGDRIRHGIYRDFPTLYEGKYGARIAVDFRVVEVLRDGRPDGYHTEDLDNGIRVYMGKSDLLLDPGDYTYTLTYETDRQLGFFADHDELYWNVTGNGWIFPIELATAIVRLPGGVPRDKITTEGYTGPQGSKEKAYRSSVGLDRSAWPPSRAVASAVPQEAAWFEATAPFAANEGLTIVVGWPKGFVAEPTNEQKVRYFFNDNLAVLIGFAGLALILFYYLAVWFRVGRDPAEGTIIPLFEAPDRLSPAAVRFIHRMGYDDKAFAAALIDMAVKKQIRIEDKDGYTIHRLDGEGGILSTDELKSLAALLGGKKSLDLKRVNHAAIQSAIQSLKTSLKFAYEKVYFLTNSWYFFAGIFLTVVAIVASVVSLPGAAKFIAIFMSIWLSGWTLGVFFLLRQARDRWRDFFSSRGAFGRGANLLAALFASLFALPFVGGEIFGIVIFVSQASLWIGGILLGAVGLNILFYHLLKAPTLAGRKVLDKIEGLRMYLGTAEKDRLNALNPPKKTPEVFEKFLPYALALDVEQEWSEQFAGILSAAGKGPDGGGYRPLWYAGTGAFTTAAFASSIGSSLSSAISSSSTAPGSRSGGGGGGSSGGGGGGGGGGGW